MAVVRSIVLLFVAALFAVAPAVAAPEPDLVPRSWEFKFEFKHPRPIAVKNLQGEYEWYWYMTYDVVNNTGQERLFIPELTIATARDGSLKQLTTQQQVGAIVYITRSAPAAPKNEDSESTVGGW